MELRCQPRRKKQREAGDALTEVRGFTEARAQGGQTPEPTLRGKLFETEVLGGPNSL